MNRRAICRFSVFAQLSTVPAREAETTVSHKWDADYISLLSDCCRLLARLR